MRFRLLFCQVVYYKDYMNMVYLADNRFIKDIKLWKKKDDEYKKGLYIYNIGICVIFFAPSIKVGYLNKNKGFSLFIKVLTNIYFLDEFIPMCFYQK